MLFLHGCLFCFFFLSPSFCEVIHFKNGRSIEGRILDKDNDFIRIKIKTGGEMIVPVSIVAKIEGYDKQTETKKKMPAKTAGDDSAYSEINKDYLKIVDRIMKEDDRKNYPDAISDVVADEYDDSEIFREIIMMEGILEEEAKQIYPEDKAQRQKYLRDRISEIDLKIMEKYKITEEKLAEIKIAGLGIE